MEAVGDETRFIYAGRMTAYTKGVDVLFKALEKLPDRGWRLDLVGGHGELVDSARTLAAGSRRIAYHGPVTTDRLGEMIQESHVCLVPSIFDGWNVTVNYALGLGVGVIASDQSVSHELVANSGAGKVVAAGDAARLAQVMRDVISNPVTVNEWHLRARAYAPLISPDSVGPYLIGCLDFALGQGEPPTAPWLSRARCREVEE